VQTFEWSGVAWTAPQVLGRLLWVGVALALALLAGLLFDRFDPSREAPRSARPKKARPEVEPPGAESAPAARPPNAARLTPLGASQPVSGLVLFFRLLVSELRLMLKGLGWWWYLVAGGLIVASLFSEVSQARQFWLPLAWLWPILAWSPLGSRDLQAGTSPMTFSAAAPVRRQLPAAWAAGFVLAVILGGGAAMRFLLAGDWGALLAWAVGAVFIPSLAVALGAWSGSHKLFEVVYLIWWYLGPWGGLGALDFAGATDVSLASGMPLAYLTAALGLLALALAGRWRQVRG
jgi:hypothetical protein